jgi:acyl carrier protein phosphodiesterase
MNFLAHLFLSQNNEDWTIGNFIADSVRSSQFSSFKSGVQTGIKIHHLIDDYTDSHPVVEETKKKLRPKHGKYSPVIGDIVYDHFLAKHFSDYSSVPLSDFTRNCYGLFRARWEELPQAVQHMLYYMEKGNWLYNYQTEEGLNKALSGMSRRASFENKMNEATADVFADYESFENDFRLFFPKLQLYIKEETSSM